MNTYDLRPLGVGEILDRAVTVFVRNFASIALVLALVLAPLAILQFLAHPNWDGYFTNLQKVLVPQPGHAADQARILRDMNAQIFPSGWAFASVGVSWLGVLLANLASMVAFGAVLEGRAISVRAVYAEAARRYLAAFVVSLMFLGIGAGAVITAMVVVFLAALAIAGVSLASHIAAVIVGIPLGLAAFVALIAIGGLAYLLWSLSLASIALETMNPVHAIGSAFGRTFNRIFWRATVVGASLLVLRTISTYLFIAIAGLLVVLTHATPLFEIVVSIGDLVVLGLINAYIVVYAIDVRVRREGYDLRLAVPDSV